MKFKKILKVLKNKILILHQSKNKNPEKARRELVLNILLSLSIISFLMINLIRLKDIIGNPHDSGIPIISTLLLLLFFIFLFFLSKKGKTSLASFLFITFYLLPVIYSFL
jgi:nitrate reductase NapE component